MKNIFDIAKNLQIKKLSTLELVLKELFSPLKYLGVCTIKKNLKYLFCV